MEFQALYNEARKYDCFYFLASLPAGTNESQELEYCFHKLGLALAVTVIGRSMVALGARVVINLAGENDADYNKTLAISLARCFNTKVIMGKGVDAPSLYSCDAEPQALQTGELPALLSCLIGQDVQGDIKTASSHRPTEGFNAALMRETWYHRTRKFGDDVIATDIVATAELNNESSPWLDSIRKTITNLNALDYLDNEIANHPAKSIKWGDNTLFDLDGEDAGENTGDDKK